MTSRALIYASMVARGSGAAPAKTARASTSRASSSKGSSAAKPDSPSGRPCWLMKAEPETRLEKGIDVAFGIDKFAAMPKQTTQWDGVRNPEARTMMKEHMRIGDRVLFYHSNCKLPGIAGLARVVREGYPDYTAWDPQHPYFDPKTDKEQPKWFMVDVQLERTLPRLVPLALLQDLRDKGPAAASKALPEQYLSPQDVSAIAAMQLLNRGRLSVQRVDAVAYDAIVQLADRGGWEDWPGKWNAAAKGKAKAGEKKEKFAKEGSIVESDTKAQNASAKAPAKKAPASKDESGTMSKPSRPKRRATGSADEPEPAPVSRRRRK